MADQNRSSSNRTAAGDSDRRDNRQEAGASERGPETSNDESTDHYGDPLSNRREERDQRRGGAEPGSESLSG